MDAITTPPKIGARAYMGKHGWKIGAGAGSAAFILTASLYVISWFRADRDGVGKLLDDHTKAIVELQTQRKSDNEANAEVTSSIKTMTDKMESMNAALSSLKTAVEATNNTLGMTSQSLQRGLDRVEKRLDAKGGTQ